MSRPTTFHSVYLRPVFTIMPFTIGFSKPSPTFMFSAETLHGSAPCLPYPRLFRHPINNWRGIKIQESLHYAVIFTYPNYFVPLGPRCSPQHRLISDTFIYYKRFTNQTVN